MLERHVEDHFCAVVASLGGEVRKMVYPGRRGAPDRLVLLHGRHLLVELKRPGERPRPNQIREHEKLRWAGFSVWVLSSVAEIDEWALEIRSWPEVYP